MPMLSEFILAICFENVTNFCKLHLCLKTHLHKLMPSKSVKMVKKVSDLHFSVAKDGV